MTDLRAHTLASFYATPGYTPDDLARAVQALARVDAADREQGMFRVPLQSVLTMLDVTVAAHAVLTGGE